MEGKAWESYQAIHGMADEKPVDGVSDFDFGQQSLHYWSHRFQSHFAPVNPHSHFEVYWVFITPFMV